MLFPNAKRPTPLERSFKVLFNDIRILKVKILVNHVTKVMVKGETTKAWACPRLGTKPPEGPKT